MGWTENFVGDMVLIREQKKLLIRAQIELAVHTFRAKDVVTFAQVRERNTQNTKQQSKRHFPSHDKC